MILAYCAFKSSHVLGRVQLHKTNGFLTIALPAISLNKEPVQCSVGRVRTPGFLLPILP